MAMVTSRNRSGSSRTPVTGYSCHVCSKPGRLSFACNVERSRNAMRCVIPPPGCPGGSASWPNPQVCALTLNGSGRVGPVELLFLADFPFRNRIVGAPVTGRGSDTAARGDFDAHVEHGHLGAGESAHQHQLVEIPQMSETEHFARHLGKPRAQCEVVAAKCHIDHVRAVDALRHNDGP